MFQKLVTLIIMLALSIPFVSLAEQNSVEAEAETAALRDADVIMHEIRTTAERDASQDTSKCLWFGAGIGTSFAAPLGLIGGFLVGIELTPSGPSSGIPYIPIGNALGGMIIGGLAGCVVAGVSGCVIYVHKPSPPTERLMGKPPEYVAFYTEVYIRKARSIRRRWALGGYGVGSLLLYPLLSLYN